ncbi:ABC transporter permease, partial [[Eubacterium] cellulosolvens]
MTRPPGISTFKLLSGGCLAFLAIFVLAVIFSGCIFLDPSTLTSALLSGEVGFAVALTLVTATVATILALIVSIPAAYVLSRAEFRGKDFVDAVINVPIALPPVALGTALLIFFTNTPLGVFIDNSIMKFVFEVPGIVLAQFSVISVLAVRLMKPVFDGIDPRYEKLARTLGHRELDSFLTVTLPLAKNGVFGAAVLAWARAMGEFGATVTLAGATRFKTETLSIAMFLNLSVANLENAMAVVLILLALTASVLLISRKIVYRGGIP